MAGTLRFVVGIMGNAASLLLYAAPILTFKKVVKTKRSEDFTCIPYILALLNCLLYTWYGLPIVSHGWENFPVISTNCIGILLEASFVLVYVWFASSKGKKKVGLMVLPAMVLFCVTVCVSAFALHNHPQRKVLVGSAGLVASIAMYASPLVVMVGVAFFYQIEFWLSKQVIKTKSVEFMPFYLSFFSLISSILWMLYGLLSRDLFLASPNVVGCPLGIFQLVIYCMYRGKVIIVEPKIVDLEKNEEKIIVLPEAVIISCVDAKI